MWCVLIAVTRCGGDGLASKNHRHALNNPYSQFRAGYSEAEVLASSRITNELTKFMCSPTSVECPFLYVWLARFTDDRVPS
jgi:acetyl-CoA acetyltransferase